MVRTFVKDLKDGDNVNEVFLLADKQLRANRNANLYLLATLRDKSGMISGLMWNVTEEAVSDIATGDMVHVRGKVQQYQGNLQMIVAQIGPAAAGTFEEDDFEIAPQANVGPLLDRLKELLNSIECPSLKILANCLMSDDALVDALCSAPAGVKAHHAYMGGLLEHIVSMSESAVRLCEVYPQLNRDLLLLGVLLHDLGKTKELAWDPSFSYTDEGQLLGHMNIAVELVSEKLREAENVPEYIPLPSETVLRIKHMILSHHGALQYGSPVLPMTPEAITLHFIDNMDARLHEFNRAINDDINSETTWTPFLPRLERRIFKGQKSE
jgi:3'-5' exoribonuclease